jgi:hypothetical protein
MRAPIGQVVVAVMGATVVATAIVSGEPVQRGERGAKAVAATVVSHPDVARRHVEPAYARLPLAFEPARTGGAFLARGAGTSAIVGTRELTLALARPHENRQALVSMRLVGASEHARLHPSGRLPGVVNEFLGNDPSRWRANIPTYSRLSAHDVYPRIDLAYHGRRGALAYDFLLAPGADPQRIALRFRGQRSVRLDRRGDLLLTLAGGMLRQARPLAFQGGRSVTARFVLLGGGLVGFALRGYDRSRPLVIDPSLAYSSYLGGGSSDYGYGIAVDPAGSAYLTGSTQSTTFPTQSPLQAANAGADDAFVTKLSADGSTLVYSTYLGGGSSDSAYGIAVDAAGSTYITGETHSTNFPTHSPVQAANAGSYDAFVAKLNAAGSALVYSSYLGGTGYDRGDAMAVDAAGSAYLTGQTDSTNFPTANPLQPMHAGVGGDDAFVTKLNPGGSALVYSTYLGGGGYDAGYGIAVGAAGNAYVTGDTISPFFPTQSPLQASNAGGYDAFVTKLSADGSALVYSTYLGGASDEGAILDRGQDIAVDAAGNAYLTGGTQSTDFPTQSPFQAANAGGYDVVVAKLNAAGSALVYSSYLGGGGYDRSYAIAVDATGSAYVTGGTQSADFPTQSPFQADHAGADDAFVAKLDAAGSALVYSSYLGGASDDAGRGIAVDAAGSAYVTGSTGSTNFPIRGALQSANAGTYDAFVTKIGAPPTAVGMRSFTAERSGGMVVLRWRTAPGVTILGFDVYRERSGIRARLNRTLLPAGNGSYTLRDPYVREARFWLAEVRLDGSRVWHGPLRPRSAR